MADFGRVLAVNTHTVGDQLVGGHLEGDTVLHLDDVSEFSTGGGTVSTDLGLLDYESVDPDADTLQLVDPLTGPLSDEARVELWDPDRGAVATETIASVALEGSEDDGDPFEGDVPQNLRAYLQDGIREGDGEIVEVDVITGQVTDVPGRTPLINVIAERIATGDEGQRVELVDQDRGTGGAASVQLWTAASQTPGQLTSVDDGAGQLTVVSSPTPPGAPTIATQITLRTSQTKRNVTIDSDTFTIKATKVTLPDPEVPSGFSVVSGWTLEELDVQKFGGLWVQMYIRVSRSGAAINVTGTGNITNSHLYQLPAGFRPVTPMALAPADTGRVVSVAVGTDGWVELAAVGGSGDLATGDVISAAGMFIAG